MAGLSGLDELFEGRHFGNDCQFSPQHQARHRCGEGVLSPGDETSGVAPNGYAASHRAVREMKADGQMPVDTKLRSSKYLNNLIEQDHRDVKPCIGPMLGFKRFSTAAVTITGIEVLRRIHKGQFDLSRLRFKDRRASAIRNAVLAAMAAE